jgi:hypothetical protein
MTFTVSRRNALKFNPHPSPAVRARGRGRNSPFAICSDPTLVQQDTYPQILQCMGITMVPLGCTGHLASNMIYQLRKVSMNSMTFSSLRAPGTTRERVPDQADSRRGEVARGKPEGDLGRVRTAINHT